VCVAVTPLVSKPSPWVLVLLEIDGPRGSRIGVLLEGQCLHWHPFLRVGAAYLFPLVTVAKEGQKHGAQVFRAAEGHTPQRLPPLSQGQAGLFENATGVRRVDVKAVSPPLPSVDDLPPSAAVLNYEGTIRGRSAVLSFMIFTYRSSCERPDLHPSAHSPPCPSLCVQRCTWGHYSSWRCCPMGVASTCSSPTTYRH
jgi:hypothetical protein